jgi:hypothetical protein
MDWVDRLQQAVRAKGKQSAVAAEANVNPSALSDILTRKTADPQLHTVIDVCRVCNVTVGWVLGESGYELGDDDFAHIGSFAKWAQKKLDQRDERTGGAPIPWVKRKPVKRKGKAPQFREDADEIRNREIPPQYAKLGADAVFVAPDGSMRDAGILEGDVLFVRRTTDVAVGQIIVCRVDGTLTVKRANDEPCVQIGIVVGVARDLL